MHRHPAWMVVNVLPAYAVGAATAGRWLPSGRLVFVSVVVFMVLSLASLGLDSIARVCKGRPLLMPSALANAVWCLIPLEMLEFRLLNNYLLGIVLFSWVCLLSAAASRLCGRCAWLTLYLYLVGTTAAFSVFKYAWKDPIEFVIFVLNVSFSPLLLVGLFNCIRLLLSHRLAAVVCAPLFLVHLFPIRSFSKVFLGALPPLPISSPTILVSLIVCGVLVGLRVPSGFPHDHSSSP